MTVPYDRLVAERGYEGAFSSVRRHVAAWRRARARGGGDGMRLAAGCDVDPAKRASVAQQYPDVRVEADFRALLDGTVTPHCAERYDEKRIHSI